MPENLERILRKACQRLGVDLRRVREGSSQKRHDVAARYVFWWVARLTYGHSYPELGAMLGIPRCFDHCSVIAGCRRVAELVERDHRVGRVAEDIAREEASSGACPHPSGS